jgi:hypothetical protein
MNLQILRTGDRCWVSDLNSRAGTSMPLSLAVGFNPIAFLLGGGAAAPAEADVINAFPLQVHMQGRCAIWRNATSRI